MEETEVSFTEIMESRAAMYGFLSRVFRKEIDRELLLNIADMRFPAETGNENLDAGYRAVCRYINTAWERSITELAVDYLSTFIGSTNEREHAAFPYESVYTSPDHLLMQDARDDVLAYYRKAGVVVDIGSDEPEDHVGFELAFMALLCERCIELGEDESDDLVAMQQSFLKNHLLSWTEDFAADVQRLAKTEFYRGCALILVGFLQMDREILKDLA